jgi:flavodoxin
MKAIIYIYSYHHNNTKKISDVIALALGAAVVELPKDDVVESADLSGYNLIGFGAGIDSGKHYKQLRRFAEKLPAYNGKKAFIFSTAGIYKEKKMRKDHKALRDILLSKGFEIAGEFSCLGHDTVAFLKWFGGINKGRPNFEDYARAKGFARALIKNGIKCDCFPR